MRYFAYLVLAVGLLSACGADTSENAKACTSERGFITIPAGGFEFGAAPLYREEGPTQFLHMDSFQIQRTEVTQADFAAFVEATQYITDVEKGVVAGRPGAGSAVFLTSSTRENPTQTWIIDADATWRNSGGANHPVVHITQQDAAAYADWAG